MRDLAAAISLLGCLTPDDARASLARRGDALAEITEGLQATMRRLGRDGLPRLLTLELEHEHAVRAAELAWTRDVVDALGDSLTWSLTERDDLLHEFERTPT